MGKVSGLPTDSSPTLDDLTYTIDGGTISKKTSWQNILLMMLDKIYPVGTIYTEISGNNPGTTLGVGSWAAYGQGRTLVGLDSSQSEFNTVNAQGGEKTHTLSVTEMPAHYHRIPYHGSGAEQAGYGLTSSPSFTNRPGISTPIANGDSAETVGGGSAHNNLQPYQVVYFWIRIS